MKRKPAQDDCWLLSLSALYCSGKHGFVQLAATGPLLHQTVELSKTPVK